MAHDYDDLPQQILGYTQFGPRGVERIVVSRRLAEEDSDVARRRDRATLAHEAGHGLLHAHLFALETSPLLLFESGDCSVFSFAMPLLFAPRYIFSARLRALRSAD